MFIPSISTSATNAHVCSFDDLHRIVSHDSCASFAELTTQRACQSPASAAFQTRQLIYLYLPLHRIESHDPPSSPPRRAAVPTTRPQLNRTTILPVNTSQSQCLPPTKPIPPKPRARPTSPRPAPPWSGGPSRQQQTTKSAPTKPARPPCNIHNRSATGKPAGTTSRVPTIKAVQRLGLLQGLGQMATSAT